MELLKPNTKYRLHFTQKPEYEPGWTQGGVYETDEYGFVTDDGGEKRPSFDVFGPYPLVGFLYRWEEVE